MSDMPDHHEFMRAISRIDPYIQQTPLLEDELLNRKLGFRLLVKAEALQVTHSFKVRGAFNQLLQLDEDDRSKGIVAFSSGNHAQAVGYAAEILNIPATIVMPKDAPALKLANTRAFGATVVLYDRHTETREALGKKIAEESGLKLIHPFDDMRTIYGQGTVGWELLGQLQARKTEADAIIVPCSGGGLAAGIAAVSPMFGMGWSKGVSQMFTAEPEHYADAAASLASGIIVANSGGAPTDCDALLAPSLGANPFRILRHYKVKGLIASEGDMKAALAIAHEHFKLVLEPGGAIGLACALRHRERFRDAVVVVIASGGNVDPEKHAHLLVQGRKIAPQLLKTSCG